MQYLAGDKIKAQSFKGGSYWKATVISHVGDKIKVRFETGITKEIKADQIQSPAAAAVAAGSTNSKANLNDKFALLDKVQSTTTTVTKPTSGLGRQSSIVKTMTSAKKTFGPTKTKPLSPGTVAYTGTVPASPMTSGGVGLSRTKTIDYGAYQRPTLSENNIARNNSDTQKQFGNLMGKTSTQDEQMMVNILQAKSQMLKEQQQQIDKQLSRRTSVLKGGDDGDQFGQWRNEPDAYSDRTFTLSVAGMSPEACADSEASFGTQLTDNSQMSAVTYPPRSSRATGPSSGARSRQRARESPGPSTRRRRSKKGKGRGKRFRVGDSVEIHTKERGWERATVLAVNDNGTYKIRSHATRQKINKWPANSMRSLRKKRLRVINSAINIRRTADFPGEATGQSVEEGTVVETTETKVVQYHGKNIRFYKLSDNRGWVYDFDPQQHMALLSERVKSTRPDTVKGKFEVFGAGIAECNGTYTENGTYDQRPQYRHPSGYELYHDETGYWTIYRDMSDWYTSTSNSNTPPRTGWKCKEGEPPAPFLRPSRQMYLKTKQGMPSEDFQMVLKELFDNFASTKGYMTEQDWGRYLEIVTPQLIEDPSLRRKTVQHFVTMFGSSTSWSDFLGFYRKSLEDNPETVKQDLGAHRYKFEVYQGGSPFDASSKASSDGRDDSGNKNVLKWNGERFQPTELEAFINGHVGCYGLQDTFLTLVYVLFFTYSVALSFVWISQAGFNCGATVNATLKELTHYVLWFGLVMAFAQIGMILSCALPAWHGSVPTWLSSVTVFLSIAGGGIMVFFLSYEGDMPVVISIVTVGGIVLFVVMMMDITRSENNTLMRLLTCNNRFLWWLNIIIPVLSYGLLFGSFLFRHEECKSDNGVEYMAVSGGLMVYFGVYAIVAGSGGLTTWMLVREDRASYGEIWKNIIHGDYEHLIEVHDLLRGLRTPVPSNGIVQQKMDIRGNYKLLQDAVEAKEALRKFMSDLASSWTDKTRPKVEIKSLPRICEKAARCYGGDFSRLLDIVRGYIVFSDGSSMLDGIRTILGRSDTDDIEILRVRNRMHPDKPYEDGGGYRNIIMNIRLRGYEHICELQITMRAINQMRIRNANEQRYRMFRNQRTDA